MDDSAQNMPGISAQPAASQPQAEDYSNFPRISINGELVDLPQTLVAEPSQQTISPFYVITGRGELSDSLEYYVRLFTDKKPTVYDSTSQSLLLHGQGAPLELLLDELAVRLSAKLVIVPLFDLLHQHTIHLSQVVEERIAEALEESIQGRVVLAIEDCEQLQLSTLPELQKTLALVVDLLKNRSKYPNLSIVLTTENLETVDTTFTRFTYIDKIVFVDKPEDEEGRIGVVETIMEKLETEKKRDGLFNLKASDVAKETQDYSYLDLRNMLESVVLTKFDQEALTGEFIPVTFADLLPLLPIPQELVEPQDQEEES